MKAAQINEYGNAAAVEVVDVDRPSVKEGQVLVEVHASSLNPFDTIVREGYMKDVIPLELPVTLGGDIAGMVVGVADGVQGISVGDVVYGQANAVAGNSGAFAEFAAVAATQVAKAPSTISIQEAASLPLVGVSALQALTEHINLQPGQKILITGGSGGIGQVAIQIAKHLGAYVAVTATGAGIERAKLLGADETFDYKSQDYTQELKGYDAAFDTVGGDELERIAAILKSDGVAVSMVGTPGGRDSVGVINQMTHVSTEKLAQLGKLVEAGIVKARIGEVFPLERVREAFTARESGSVSGKVVLKIKD